MLADGVLRLGGQCAAFAFLFLGGIMEPDRQGKARSLMRFSNGSRADEKVNNAQTMEGQLVQLVR